MRAAAWQDIYLVTSSPLIYSAVALLAKRS
jgi:hypothetical protein